jgi:hypothetical protein
VKNVKRIVSFLWCVFMCGGAVFADNGSLWGKSPIDYQSTPFLAGLKAGIGIGAYSPAYGRDSKEDKMKSSDTAFLPGLYAAMNFKNSLMSVQMEFDFLINNGATTPDGIDHQYASLDIPVLFRFNPIRADMLLVSAVAGPYVSIPLGEMEMSQGDAVDLCLTAGLLIGASVGFRVGPGLITLDARYAFDVIPLKEKGRFIDTEGYFLRAFVPITLGYEFWLK